MAFATDIFRFIALAQILLTLALFWKGRRNQKGTGICLFFGLSIAGYLLVDWPPLERNMAVRLPLLVLPFLAPAAFWLFSKLLFDDGFQWQRSWWWLLGGVAVVYYLVFFQNNFQILALPPSLKLLAGLSTQLIALTFILLGILEAARNRADDLVLSRLQFRTVFIIATALLMAVTALVEISLANAAPPPVLGVLQKAGIAVLAMFFAVNRLAFQPGFLPCNEPPAAPEAVVAEKEVAADGPLLEQLTEIMGNQQAWRTEGLTIRLLSEKMGVKEYRLRQAINQHLGYRNFNDYLNGYRIREACAVLSDPSKRDLTVLEISYQLGYASLAPFNKAFKDTTGMTPTEWRKKTA